MNASSFIETNQFLRLPIQQTNGSFRKNLFNLLDRFSSEIKSVEVDEKLVFDLKVEHQAIDDLIAGIKQTVQEYLNGHPSKAYNTLHNCLERNLIFSYIASNDLNVGQSLYRLREYNENYALKPRELFHIPFHLRGKVGTQRYSIPGFPCLYLANSVYVAWEELGRKPIDVLHATRLENAEVLCYLDLTTDVYTGKSKFIGEKSEEALWNHLKAWPLIAACSFKVFDRKNPFKPEYIIPQLLLQIVRSEKDGINGIRFSSTHVNLNIYEHEGEFYNFVIPVQSECDDGYCKGLISTFKMTDVVPWQLAQGFSEHKQGFVSIPDLHSRIEQVELVNGLPQRYLFTTFAKLEEALNLLEAKPIPVN